MKIYDLDGNEHDKPSIDCSECVENLGWSLSPPQGFTKEISKEKPKTRNVAEIRGLLDQRNIPYRPSDGKKRLLKLLDA